MLWQLTHSGSHTGTRRGSAQCSPDQLSRCFLFTPATFKQHACRAARLPRGQHNRRKLSTATCGKRWYPCGAAARRIGCAEKELLCGPQVRLGRIRLGHVGGRRSRLRAMLFLQASVSCCAGRRCGAAGRCCARQAADHQQQYSSCKQQPYAALSMLQDPISTQGCPAQLAHCSATT